MEELYERFADRGGGSAINSAREYYVLIRV